MHISLRKRLIPINLLCKLICTKNRPGIHTNDLSGPFTFVLLINKSKRVRQINHLCWAPVVKPPSWKVQPAYRRWGLGGGECLSVRQRTLVIHWLKTCQSKRCYIFVMKFKMADSSEGFEECLDRDGGVLFQVGGLSAEGTICERRGRETSRGSGEFYGLEACCPEKFWNLESLKCHFLHYGGRIYRILIDRKRHIKCQNLHAPSIE